MVAFYRGGVSAFLLTSFEMRDAVYLCMLPELCFPIFRFNKLFKIAFSP